MPLTEEEVYERIIWSADVSDVGAIEARLDAMPKLRVVKIDRFFVDANGWEVFSILQERGILVFDDAKIAEIPSKSRNLAMVHCRKARPWMLNCMAGIESNDVLDDPDPEKLDGLKRFADTCRSYEVKPCAVTVLTSKMPEIVAREFNGRTVVEQVLYYVDLLERSGFTDIICSPEEATAIRSEPRFDHLDINNPGIRPAGTAAGDQARTNTPGGALHNGATRVVIGRPITNDGLLDAIATEMLVI